MKIKTFAYSYILSATFVLFSHQLHAAARGVEDVEADALIAFHEGRYDDALNQINEALKDAPNELSLLELKALTLKSQGLWRNAYRAYAELAAIKDLSAAKRAAYEFEMGLIQFKQKNYASAEPHLRYSLRQRFNTPVSEFLLGSIFLEKKDVNKAELFFRSASRSDLKEFSAQSHMALVRIAMDKEQYAGALKHVIAAREVASEMIATDAQSALGKQIMENTQSLVDRLEKSSWNGNVGVITAYDSNVMLNPTVTANADGASQSASLKQSVLFSLGYSTSAVKDTQWAATYQGVANFNFTEATKPGQFLINDLTVVMTDNPQLPLKYGFKGGAQFIMRYGAPGSSTAGTFAPYSAVGTAGPFVRNDYARGKAVGAEVLFQPQFFLQDNESPSDYKKTGWGGTARLYYFSEGFGQIGLMVDLRQTQGTEFNSKTAGIEFSSPRRLGKRVTLLPALSTTYTVYQTRGAGFRGDWFANGQMNLAWMVTNSLQVTSGVQVAKNFSNITDTYEYFRYMGSLGMNYLF